MTLRTGSEVVVDIVDLALGGRGVARQDGLVLFVQGALTGERVRARIDRVRRSFVDATVIEIVRPSPDRRTPPCKHYEECGGCDLQHLEAGAQARAKRAQVAAALARIGGLSEVQVSDCVASPQPLGYRFRMDFDWRATARGSVLGLHRRGSSATVVPIERCLLASDLVSQMLQWLAHEAAARRLGVLDPRTGRGLLRRATFQEARETRELLVTLETGRGDPPALGAFAADLRRRFPRTVGVVRREVARAGGGVVVSILAGRDFLYEEVDGDRFKIPAEVFFQPNPAAAGTLRRQAVTALQAGGRRVLELYSGVGFFTLAVAREAAEVVAVEGSAAACATARDNASRAGLGNCTFIASDVQAALPRLLEQPIDTVLLDPPRTGLPPGVAASLGGLGARRIVYVSCDPGTLARDLALIVKGGHFSVACVTPFDLFPQTQHVECVAEMERV